MTFIIKPLYKRYFGTKIYSVLYKLITITFINLTDSYLFYTRTWKFI